jgi:hypothetical protein
VELTHKLIMFYYSFLLFTLFCASALSVPLQWESSSCAQTCNSDPLLIRYDVGKTYFYNLDSVTNIQYGNEGNGGQEVGIKARVELSTHSPCEMSLQLRDVQLQGIQNVFDLKQQLESNPIQFGFDDGHIVGVCPSLDDELWAINVKKSIISALQMTAKSTDSKSIVTETDILGKCETIYEPISKRYATLVIQKSKALNRCSDRQQTQIGFFPRKYGLNEVLMRTSAPIMNSSFICSQTIDKDVIIGTTCEERQLLWPSNIVLASNLNLRFEKQIQGLSARRVQQFGQRHQLLMSSRISSKNQNFDESEFMSLLRTISSQIQNDVLSPETTQTFPQMVTALEQISKSGIQRIWSSVESGEISSSPKLRDLFLDALALASSEASIEILVNEYNSGKISRERSSYLFSLMAFTSHPNENALKLVLPLLQSRDTPKQVVLGITGFIHNLKVVSNHVSKQLLKQSIDAIVERIQSSGIPSEMISLIKSLENIGFEDNSEAKQFLLSLAQNSRQKQGVRVSAINALTDNSDQQIREELLKLFRTESESNELRISAYKSVVMSGGVTQRQLEQIRDQLRRESNQNIVNYVRSHQKNLRQTSDPHKRDVLPINAPEFESAENELGYSRNMELSYLHESTQIGFALETDLVFPKQSRIPRSITFNVSVPAFGKELQLIEVNVRQLGLDSVIGEKLRRIDGNIPKIFRELLELFTDSNVIQSQRIVLQMNLKIDGKTVLFLDSKDLELNFDSVLNQLKQQLEERLEIDRSFALIPFNTRIEFPTINGFPMTLRLNSSLVSGLKADLKLNTRQLSSALIEAIVLPSIAIQFEAGIDFEVKNEKKSLELISRMSSSPVLDTKAEVRDGRILNVKINLPKEKQSLVKIEMKVYERDQSNGRRVRSIRGHSLKSHKWSTKALNKPLGVAFVSEFSYSKPLFPLSEINGEISFIKTDKSMKSFEMSLEMPPKNAKEMQVFRAMINTPQSEIDRELSAELQLNTPQNGKKEARLELRSPWKRFNAVAQFRNEDKERAILVELNSDGTKLLTFDLALESNIRGQKREYRPRLRLQLSPNSEPIALQGSVSVSKGRKNQIQINLEGNQKQLIKGSFVREGFEKKSNDFRISSDLTLNLPGIELRISGLGDKASKHMMTDLNVEYKLYNRKKESFKLSAKLQNLTQTQLTKMSAFGELTSTQFPKFNFHLAYNLLRKPFEHIENELTIAWKQQLKDKIHVLQVSKYSKMDSTSEQKIENTLVLEMTPFSVDYELRANAELNRRGIEGPKYNVELIGKDRTGRKENDIKGLFEYRHISRSPLHLSMDASLRTSNREMSYRDELKEVSPNQYNGKTSVQWQRGKAATLDYNYKIKSDSQRTHHEIDAELKTPHSSYPIRHQGLLKMTRNELELKSEVNYQGQQLYHFDSLLNKNGLSKLNVDLKGVQTKFNVNPYSIPQLASVEVSSDGYHHKSNVELVPKTSFALKSDTKRNARNIFAVESHISRTEPSRLVINSDPFEGRVDFDPISSERKTGNLEIRVPNKWTHISQYNYEPNNRLIGLKSNTESNGRKILSFDSQLSKREKSFLNLETPQLLVNLDSKLNEREKNANLELKTEQISHKSSVQWKPKEVKFVSNTLKGRQQMADIDYNFNNGLHSLNFESPKYSAQFEGQYEGQYEGQTQGFGRIGFKGKESEYEHNTKVTKEPNIITIESRTQKRGNNLVNLNALLARNSQSNVKLVTPHVTTQLNVKPFSSAKFEWNSPKYDHLSALDYNTNEWNFDSKTQSKDFNRNSYNFQIKHFPQKQSLISAKIPSFESQVVYYKESPKLKVEFFGKQNIPYEHVTEFEVKPEYSLDSPKYSLKSRTNQLNGENILSLGGNYYSVSQSSNPSNFEVKYGQQLEAKLKVNPYSREKYLNFETKGKQINHVTNIQMDSKSLNVKSRTDSLGKNVAKIDSYLTPEFGQRSHLSIVTSKGNANLEFERQKRAKIELRIDPFSHESELISHQTGYKLNSKTLTNGQNLLNINSNINRGQLPSNFQLNSPLVSTQLAVNPLEKSAKIELKTNSFEHKTNVRNFAQKLQIQSKTDLNNRLLAHLNTELTPNSENLLDLEIPHFISKSSLNLNEKKASIDFRSKLRNGRHVLASIQLNPNSKNGFHSDISWDAQKDPNQRLILDFSAQREGSSWGSNQELILSMEAQYAKNQLKFISKMNSQNIIYGPHELTIDYIPIQNPSRDSMTLKVNHVIHNNEIQCKWTYLEANEIKYSAQLNGKLNPREGIVASFETTAPKNPELEYKMSFNQRQTSNEWFAELKANRGESQQYKVSVNLEQESRDRVKGLLSLETPTIEGQNVNFLLEKSQKMFSLNAINQNGKQLELKSDLTENSANFDLKSNLDRIPSIRANARFVMKKEISLTVDVDSDRKLDFYAKVSDNLRDGLNFNARLDSVWTPNMEFNARAKQQSNELQIKANAKYNFREVFASELKAEKRSSYDWNGNGFFSLNGAELARASLESSFGSNSLQYILNANGKQFSPIHVTFGHSKITSDEKKTSLKMCSNERCVDLELSLIKDEKWSSIPKKLSFVLRKLGTNVVVHFSLFENLKSFAKHDNSVLNISSNKRIENKIRNQLLVSINSHSIGYDLITSKRADNAFDSLLQLHFPSNRIMQIRTDYVIEGQNSQTLKMDFKPDSRDVKPLFESLVNLNSNPNEFSAKMELSSEKFRRNPKVLSLIWRKSIETKPLDLQIFIDLAKNPNNALTIETQFEQNFDQKNNKTLNFEISTRDRKAIDFMTKIHFSSESFGLFYQNMNRFGQRNDGFFYFKLIGNQKFEAILRNSKQFNYKIEGNFQKNSLNEFISDFTIINEKTSVEREIRLNLNQNCLLIESKKSGINEKRISFCANHQNSKLLAINMQSIDENSGEKTVDFQLEIDSRNGKTLRIHSHWDPQNVKHLLLVLAQNYENSINSDSSFNQISDELKHKSLLITKQLTEEIVLPFISLFGDEFEDLFQELAKNFSPVMKALERFSQNLPNFQQIYEQYSEKVFKPFEWIFGKLSTKSRNILRNFRKQCKYSETCYQMVYAFDNYGINAVFELLTTKMTESLKKTHRFVITTSGQLIRSLPSVPVPEFVKNIYEEYSMELKSTFETIINSNQDLKQFVFHLKQIFNQLIEENFDSINWSRVQQSAKEIADIVFSRSSWSSSSRVLVWDPLRGEIQIEMRSPIVHTRRLRAVMESVSMKMSTNQNKTSSLMNRMYEKMIQPIKSRFS